ncbi:hypothetical protein, partial [Enterococcus faecalis]|uniref:hypothetical protein n=1 Tax=Enterococcus faecalis TaxID=1351 RepID=UPI001C40275B
KKAKYVHGIYRVHTLPFYGKFFRKEAERLLFVSGLLVGSVLATFFMASFLFNKTEETRIKTK